MGAPSITAGTDGTAAGTAAVRWAAREAVRRNLLLRIVHVLQWDWAVSRYDFAGEHFRMAREGAQTVVRDAVRQAAEAAPGLMAAEAQVRIGRPMTQLLNASVGAAGLVVGTRAHGGLSERLLGSSARRIAAHAHCPVVVVRGRADPGAGPVATGVDDSACDDAVLDAAFATAAGRDASLVVVRSYAPTPATEQVTADPEAAHRDRLAEQLAPWQNKYPQVAVETLVSAESTAATLTEISHGTQLIVAGHHGHGLISGNLFNATTGHLLQHSDCPVLVVSA
ncbi:universal stress protein [Actinoplanes sp. NPDC020271]|uniref:universal stress protein n=1 Tax=Actinoplanes sp. NPDC020271 TaxID=3363896 RepID=UPI0037A9441A